MADKKHPDLPPIGGGFPEIPRPTSDTIYPFLKWVRQDLHRFYGEDQPFTEDDAEYWQTRYVEEWMAETTVHNLDGKPLTIKDRDIRVRNRLLQQYRIFGVQGSRPRQTTTPPSEDIPS